MSGLSLQFMSHASSVWHDSLEKIKCTHIHTNTHTHTHTRARPSLSTRHKLACKLSPWFIRKRIVSIETNQSPLSHPNSKAVRGAGLFAHISVCVCVCVCEKKHGLLANIVSLVLDVQRPPDNTAKLNFSGRRESERDFCFFCVNVCF